MLALGVVIVVMPKTEIVVRNKSVNQVKSQLVQLRTGQDLRLVVLMD